ncbi:FAD-binding oxidoreductase [Henriciella sp.]|uniref:FAD-binding oxidoreductase n=1 Tax=Henriciella sp. TaxID=1968823 RepID=UPI0025C39A54|nr:FAD-binding oxidoreductase [Henriciella sp.]
MADPILSWGRVHRFEQDVDILPRDATARGTLSETAFTGNESVIAHGLGRSYGDVALNEGGRVLLTPRHDFVLEANWETGLFRASAGLSLAQLHKITVPRGWFVPVTPGTKFVTLGGAVANDVHGKNHHQASSFGHHVTRLKLCRSDGEAMICSREENSEFFALTLGGLGLTGIIDWVEFQLKPIASSNLFVENIACPDLAGFFELSQESAAWPYTVMWVDCLAPEKARGRGIFTRGRPVDSGPLQPHDEEKSVKWPFTTPSFLLNPVTLKTFNALYRMRPGARFVGEQRYDPFFYPLDRIREWNKLYGKKGFFQHQAIIPMESGREGIAALLEAIEKAGQGSFLAVLKVHGPERSPGVMSFCREGVSLALDFANKGRKTLALLERLDAIVLEHGGRIYPAKDGHMSASFFQACYPQWTQLESARDPMISSSFWRRVTQND